MRTLTGQVDGHIPRAKADSLLGPVLVAMLQARCFLAQQFLPKSYRLLFPGAGPKTSLTIFQVQ